MLSYAQELDVLATSNTGSSKTVKSTDAQRLLVCGACMHLQMSTVANSSSNIARRPREDTKTDRSHLLLRSTSLYTRMNGRSTHLTW